MTKFETLTFDLNADSTGIVEFKKRSCPSSKWTETWYKDGVDGDGGPVSESKAVVPIEFLRDQVYSVGVDVYNMVNDALAKKFIPAVNNSECNGIYMYSVEELQWCTLQSGKTHKVNGTVHRANEGLMRDGERVTSYENLSVEISYFCNGNRRGFSATFQFGGPSVAKCRNKVVFNGNTV
eukprot:jgi/Picsp_1/3530/NSC_06368-R1_---NA---